MAETRKIIDWEAIEREYRMGQKSMRTIADQFGTTAGAISKKAKSRNWVQDKSAEIRQRTRAALFTETPDGNGNGNAPSEFDIDAAVKTNLEVIRGHRKCVGHGLKIQEQILSKLQDDLDDDKIKLSVKQATLKDVSIALKNLIPLERQAFNLDDHGGDDNAPDSVTITYRRKRDDE